MKFMLAGLLLLASSVALPDTIYTFSGATGHDVVPGPVYGFTYDVTTGRFLDLGSGSLPPNVPGLKLANWPWPVWQIQFDFEPISAENTPVMKMGLGMADSLDGEPEMVGWDFYGFVRGDMGTYQGNSDLFAGAYGTPEVLTLTVSDSPSAPEPGSAWLLGGGLALLGCLVGRKYAGWPAT